MDTRTLKLFNREEVEKLLEKKDWKALRKYNFREADLSSMDFTGAELGGLNFSETDFGNACLNDTDFSNAKFNHTNLRNVTAERANFHNAIFSHACLRNVTAERADFSKAYFGEAILNHITAEHANFHSASFQGACLIDVAAECADFGGAFFYNADLKYANLERIIIDTATRYFGNQCPKEGEFTGYKKAYNKSHSYIVELHIPAHALRSSATTRKCRCSEAEVISITHLNGTKAKLSTVYSRYNPYFKYTVGKTVKADGYEEDRWKECAPGIHFFMDRDKAVSYDF